MSNDSKLPTVLLLMLMGIVILLMVAIVGLFIHMNQLQHEVLVALSGGMTEQEVGLEIGIQAPSFTLPDTTGSMVSLEDFAGQRVLLGFSSTHCPACARMYPHLRALGESRDDVQVVMISQGSVEDNRQLVEDQGFGFPILAWLTWEDEITKEYRVPGTPFFCVVDENGVIVNKGFANSLEQLETLVRSSGE